MDGRQFFEDYFANKTDKPDNYIVMPKSSFVKEHNKLLGILDRKQPTELNKERKEQAKELRQYLKKGKKGK